MRIQALIRRNTIIMFRGLDTLFDYLYWPLLDLIVWGFAATSFRTIQSAPATLSVGLLTALVIWQGAYRASFDIAFNLLQEFWGRNTINLFATPMTLVEWITAALISSIVNFIPSIFFAALVTWLLYGISIFSLGWFLCPIIFFMALAGWSISLFSAGILMAFGQRIQKLVWILSSVFMPFAGIFYPVHLLPTWAQYIAHALPLSYLFESLRMYLLTTTIPWAIFSTGIILSIIYFCGAILFFILLFNYSKRIGLGRLDNQ